MAVLGQTAGGDAVGSYACAAMSELRRKGPDDADHPAETPAKPERPGERPDMEIRSADQNPDWPVDRRKVTAAQRYYSDLVKQMGDAPPIGETGVVYVRDWSTGESLDHRHRMGRDDRTEPGDSNVEPGSPDAADPPEEAPSLPYLDASAFHDADDGWDDVVAPTDDHALPDADGRTDDDLRTAIGVPEELGPDSARSTSMDISEVRDQIAKSDSRRPPDFDRDNSRLEARTVERTDEGWYDRLEGPEPSNYESRFKNFRAKYAQKSNGIGNMVHDSVDNLKGLFSHPPTHESVGHVPPAPDMPAPLHGAHTAGDLASGVVAGAFAVSALTRMMQDKLENRKDRHGDNG